MRTLHTSIALLATLITLGCGADGATTDDGGAVLVDPGKADNFFSQSAQEYYITGETFIDLAESYGDRTEAERRVRGGGADLLQAGGDQLVPAPVPHGPR